MVKTVSLTNSALLANVLSNAQIGLWAIESDPDSAPRMYIDATMCRLLGIDASSSLTPEQIYRHWYDRIDPDHYREVNAAVAQMVDWKDAEVQYPWRHPQGEVVVRCGGIRSRDYTQGIRIEGCHRIVTDLIHVQKERAVSLSAVSGGGDRILAAITRQLYSFNITVDLETGKFSLIQGTGMSEAWEEIQKAPDYRVCYALLYNYVQPEFHSKFRSLLSLDFLRNVDLASGFVGSLEYSADVKGANVWREVNVFVDTDEKGRRWANILGRDITERRKRDEARLRELESVNARDRVLSEITTRLFGFNLTINLQTGTYTVIDGTGVGDIMPLLRASNDYCVTLDRVIELVDPEYHVPVRKLLGFDYLIDAPEQKTSLGHVTHPIMLGGTRHWFETVVFRSEGGDGVPLAYVLVRDVTEAHERHARREREQQAAAAKDALLSGITKALYGYNLNIDLLTQKYSLIAGSGLESSVKFLERTDDYRVAIQRKLSHVPEGHRTRLEELASPDKMLRELELGHSGLFKTLEYPALIQGRQTWEEVTIFLKYDATGRPRANLLVRDVTDAHARLDAEREAERKMAEAKSFFFSTVSHDIRTPLNSILGYAELLKLGISDPAEREQALGTIVASGNVLMALINDVLDLSKLESGKMEIVPEPTDVVALVRETADAFKLRCEKKGIALKVEMGAIPPLKLDPQRIRQVLFNLLGNAVKFTDKGSVTVRVIWDEGRFALSIVDTGCGIAPENQGRLMSPYVQIQGAGSHEGTGLGLAICKQLAMRMGGTLTLESTLGEGSTFTFELPHVVRTRLSSSSARSKNAPVGIVSKVRRILIVDDSPVNLKVLEAMLRRLGVVDVLSASSGAEALERQRREPADLVLTDLWMPEMDGVALVSNLRTQERDMGRSPIPVYVVTADVEAMKNVAEQGFTGVVLKPLTLEGLGRILEGQ